MKIMRRPFFLREEDGRATKEGAAFMRYILSPSWRVSPSSRLARPRAVTRRRSGRKCIARTYPCSVAAARRLTSTERSNAMKGRQLRFSRLSSPYFTFHLSSLSRSRTDALPYARLTSRRGNIAKIRPHGSRMRIMRSGWSMKRWSHTPERNGMAANIALR